MLWNQFQDQQEKANAVAGAQLFFFFLINGEKCTFKEQYQKCFYTNANGYIIVIKVKLLIHYTGTLQCGLLN